MNPREFDTNVAVALKLGAKFYKCDTPRGVEYWARNNVRPEDDAFWADEEECLPANGNWCRGMAQFTRNGKDAARLIAYIEERIKDVGGEFSIFFDGSWHANVSFGTVNTPRYGFGFGHEPTWQTALCMAFLSACEMFEKEDWQ